MKRGIPEGMSLIFLPEYLQVSFFFAYFAVRNDQNYKRYEKY